MLQSLVITLREGVEAALIIGIVLGYLKKTGRASWSRIVYWGMFWALVSSVVAAYFVHRLALAEEAYEGWLMLAGAVFVVSMVVWMWRAGKRVKQEIEAKLSALSGEPGRAATLGLFLFVFLMVLREGVETVLFLAAVSLRTSDLMNFIGGIIGLALAILLGVAFFNGSLKVNLRKFFAVTSVVLMVVAAQLGISGVHELMEAKYLPSGPREMALVGPIVNRDAFFFVVMVALALFLAAAQRIREAGLQGVALAGLPGPERRKLLAERRRERFWKTAASTVGLLVIILISAEFIYSRTAGAMSPPELLILVEGEARIPVARLADHNLHRYAVQVGNQEARLIAILDSSDTVRAGLDACEICGTQGYYQDGNNVVCRNCAAAIYVPSIGMAGGCNPIHIDYRIENGDTLVFSRDALASGAKHFR